MHGRVQTGNALLCRVVQLEFSTARETRLNASILPKTSNSIGHLGRQVVTVDLVRLIHDELCTTIVVRVLECNAHHLHGIEQDMHRLDLGEAGLRLACWSSLARAFARLTCVAENDLEVRFALFLRVRAFVCRVAQTTRDSALGKIPAARGRAARPRFQANVRMSFICLRTVDLPDSPAPSSSLRGSHTKSTDPAWRGRQQGAG